MCTLIVGVDVVKPGSVLLAANRDEDPDRPCDPPGVLSESPRLVGGRDRRAGGTWLAVRERRAAVALLNRRDVPGALAPPVPGRRSRGALVLDVAAADERDLPMLPLAAGPAEPPGPGAPSGSGLSIAALRQALAVAQPGRFAPCTLVFAAPGGSWLMAIEGDGAPRIEPITTGWHVLTHADLDDPGEPRTARLVRELAAFSPRSLAEAEARLDTLLRSHGEGSPDLPPVCLHDGRMVTVSASSVWLAAGEARYRHTEGRPCEHPLADLPGLLGPGV